MKGWKFEYDKWQGGTNFRSGTDRNNPFSKERVGSLEYKLSSSLSVTLESILRGDVFILYFLLFPFGDPSLNTLLR